MHGSGWYARCTDLFQMDRPTWAEWQHNGAAPAGLGEGAMTVIASLSLPDEAPQAATIVASATGIIILAFPGGSELWCRPLRHGPKVLTGTAGSGLLRAGDFAHKIRHLKRLANGTPPLPVIRPGRVNKIIRRGVNMKKTAFWAAGVAALALATQPALAADTIKIGFVSTFSGPTAAIGNDMRNSFELALDHLGRKMDGKPVEVIYEDDGQKPDVGKQKTEKLIQSDKVDFIVGYIWSNVLLASLKTAVDFEDLPDLGQCRAVAARRRTLLALCVLDLLAERPDAAGDGHLHEPEGRQVGIPDRPELRRRQGHAGRRQEHLQG